MYLPKLDLLIKGEQTSFQGVMFDGKTQKRKKC